MRFRADARPTFFARALRMQAHARTPQAARKASARRVRVRKSRTYLKVEKRYFLAVIPAKAGIQPLLNSREKLDSGFRRNDDDVGF
jgi:hypothetical protein